MADAPGERPGQFAWTMGVLGSLATATALISLVQNWSDIELARLPARYVEYYRGLVQALVGWVALPFGLRIPQWYLDGLAINAVVAAAASRAIFAVDYFQRKLFQGILIAATLVGLAWIVAPALVLWLKWFSGRNIENAQNWLAEWKPRREGYRASQPGGEISQVDREIAEHDKIVADYRVFASVTRLFVVFLGVTVLATLAFFVINASLVS